MKALVKTAPQPGLSMEDVPTPTIGPNDVLIKIKKTAICGTDMHIYNWDNWAKSHIQPPLIVGHEFVGDIIDIGREVTSYFKVGDRISGEGHIACGHCRNCRASRSHLCRSNISVGVTRHGAFAEYLAIPAVNAYPIPNTISDNEATVLDPLGNATHAALSFDVVGEDILITGAGPVGMMAAAIARHNGARFIVITDVNDYRRALAEKVGVTLAINPNTTTLDQAMAQLDMKEGFDIGFEMSGHPHAFNSMITHMNHAGKLALLGFIPEQTGIDWNQVILKGLTIKGIYGREMYDTWYKMITMLQSGLNIKPIITHEYPCHEFQTAFNLVRSGASGKVLLNWAS